MSKLRSLNTAFWSDTWVEELEPMQKLLFIYLVTNEKTNMLGIYEASVKKISFETGIASNVVKTYLKEFEESDKVKYIDNRVILINYMKHQNYNTNMKKSAIDTYNDLPNSLKVNGLDVSKGNPIEGFERLSKAYGMVRKVEYEVEYEVETKLEDEKEFEDESIFHDITVLQNHYLDNERLLKAVLSGKNNKVKSIDDIKLKLDLFCKNLIEQGRFSETWKEFTRYFLNSLKSGKFNDLNTQNKAITNPNNEELIKYNSNVNPTVFELPKSKFLEMQEKNKEGGYIYKILN